MAKRVGPSAGQLSEERARYILSGIDQSGDRMQTAKLFKNGRSQAVRLPKEFRFQGDEVYVKRVGGGVMLLPKSDPWASIAEAYAIADPKHPIRRHKAPAQKRSFKWR
jgi:antitoxin VapB